MFTHFESNLQIKSFFVINFDSKTALGPLFTSVCVVTVRWKNKALVLVFILKM